VVPIIVGFSLPLPIQFTMCAISLQRESDHRLYQYQICRILSSTQDTT